MTITSMTGFSSINIALPLQDGIQSQVSLSLKTLNSRFFESNCKLPHALNYLETDLIKLFKSEFKRGTIYFSLHMNNLGSLTRTVQPSLTLIGQYVQAVQKIKDSFTVQGNLDLSNLLQLPDIFETQEIQFNQSTIDILMDAIKDLVESVQKARLQEGEKLAEDLFARIKVMEEYIQKLEPRAEESQEKRKEQILQNFKDLLKQSQITESELTREAQAVSIYNQLDKIAIHEEIVRFKLHLENLKNILNNKDLEKGKKIDFTLQELFREINTIAAKCSDAIISSIVINIKVELEKAREQAQNII